MKKEEDSIQVEFKEGVHLKIFPIGNYAKIFKIDEAEAEKFGEASVQILESKRYEYEFSDNSYQLEKSKECIPSKSQINSRGIISPGNYVGTLELNILSEKDDQKYYLEVLATKFDASNDYQKDYRTDYRLMVEDITEKCTELLMQSNSPVNQYFEPDPSEKNKTVYQKFSFVKSIINSEEFEESILKIFTSPKTNWVNKEEKVDIRSIKRFTNKNVQEVLRGKNRMPLPEDHHLSKTTKLQDVPTKINNYKQEPSLDNPENRFIKHALEIYLKFCEDCSVVFKPDFKDHKEALFLTHKLTNFLNHSFFDGISRPHTLNLNSPTLQRKSGYRQVLKSWLMFDLASKLSWTGGEDIYEAGKRDIATLYEYWLFFVLYDLFKSKFDLNEIRHEGKPYDHLFEKTKGNLDLIIKSGQHTALKGDAIIKNRPLNIKFSFNRTFSGNKDSFPSAGSWTTSMRPDYTLTIWPKELKEKQAEIQEEIVHIHFDAKYKVNHFTIKSNTSNHKIDKENERENLNKQKRDERAGKFKNADLLKMHAYKDAIRRTGGAYILYPGNRESKFKGFHEIIPGLGAFSLNPNNDTDDVSKLEKFIDQVIDHLDNRISHREKIAHQTYGITKGYVDKTEYDQNNIFNEPVPEYVNGEKLIPDETFVLVGYCKSDAHLDWIQSKMLYNFRMNNNRGALKLTRDTLNAKFLLLHMKGDKSTSRFFKIKKPEYRVTDKATLKRLAYPNPRQESYLVVSLEPCSESDFKNISWDIRELDKYKSGRASAIPFTTSLPTLMKTEV